MLKKLSASSWLHLRATLAKHLLVWEDKAGKEIIGFQCTVLRMVRSFSPFFVALIVTLCKIDEAPSLIIWFFDSRSGFTPGANSVPLPDWVDDSVATWIKSETDIMNSVWGPSDKRAAIAFVHIPL
jgi:hypothetical protein